MRSFFATRFEPDGCNLVYRESRALGSVVFGKYERMRRRMRAEVRRLERLPDSLKCWCACHWSILPGIQTCGCRSLKLLFGPVCSTRTPFNQTPRLPHTSPSTMPLELRIRTSIESIQLMEKIVWRVVYEEYTSSSFFAVLRLQFHNSDTTRSRGDAGYSNWIDQGEYLAEHRAKVLERRLKFWWELILQSQNITVACAILRVRYHF